MPKQRIVFNDSENKRCWEDAKRQLSVRLKKDVQNDELLKYLYAGRPDLFPDRRPVPTVPRRVS